MAGGNYGVYDRSSGRYYVIGPGGQRPATQAEAAAIHAYGGSYTFPVNYVAPDTMGYGVYDESKRKFVVYDLGGRWRDATAGEAAQIQAAGGSYTRPKVEGETTLAPPPDAAPAPATPTTPAPGATPAPAPDPYADWERSDPNTRTYRWFDENARAFYEDNPTAAWEQYTRAMFGDRQTNFVNYAQNKYQQYYNEYLKNSEANAGAQANFTQSLTRQNADAIRQSWNMENASTRGFANVYNPGGRQTFGPQRPF